ncbi:ester cyclase [Nocardia sp. NBC_01499]|uniref:ester cyclase n=1 Tax=Nocardia sp. NBC_01499 TaxID=2903597 RepID=UPI00386C8A03
MSVTDLDERRSWWETRSETLLARATAREQELIEQGMPAHGMTEWARAWLSANNSQDYDAVDACVTPDVQWEHPTSYDQHVNGRKDFRTFCGQFWNAMPDLRCYPADDPWIDVQDGNARCCIPWTAIGTFTGPLHLWPCTSTSPKLAPNGASFEFHGVDRYTFVRTTDGPGGFQVRHGKADYDLLSLLHNVGLAPTLTSWKARPLLLGLNAVAQAQRATRKAIERIRR